MLSTILNQRLLGFGSWCLESLSPRLTNWSNEPVACYNDFTEGGALRKLLNCEGGAGAEGAILPYVDYLQLISTLEIVADCCQLCQYKLTKPNQT